MSGCFTRRRWAVLAMAIPALMTTTRVAAQTQPSATSPADSDTIYFGGAPQEEPPKFYVAPLRGYLELRSTYTNSENSSKTTDQSSFFRDESLEETLTLYSNGYVKHPNIMDFRFSITGGLSQEWTSSDLGSDTSLGTVYGWDINVIFFRNEPGNLTLYSRRNQSFLDIPFGPTETVTNTSTGALWNYHTSESTLQLEAFHEVNSQEVPGDFGTDFTETRDVFRGSGDTRLTENQTLTWSFDLENATFDSGGDSDDEQSASLSLSHVASFGESGRSSLSSGLSYSITNGTLDREDIRWNEHLHIYHSDWLETNYDYAYERLTYGDATTERNAAYADLRHQLYKSLVTNGRVSWEHIGGEDSATTTYNADLSLNYHKNVPGGVFLADASVGRQIEQIDQANGIFFSDQSVTFVNLDPLTVAQPNAIPTTVVLRDAGSGRTYVEGIDYTVRQTPVGLEVDRVIGGNILPGQPLLLRYSYEPLNADEITTDSFALGVRYQVTKGALTGLAPFARVSGQDQSISGGTAVPAHVRDYLAGVDYEYNGLTLRAEREKLESNLFPYDAWRYEARYNSRLSSYTEFSVSATYSDIQYHNPEQETRDYTLNASASHNFTTELSGSIYAAYVNSNTDGAGTTEGFEEGLELSWLHRDTKAYMRLRNTSLNSEVAEQRFQFFQIGLIRNF